MFGNEDARMPSGRRAGQGDQLEAAEYIASNLLSLAQIAWQHRLDTLGYLIDMARMEAEEASKALHSGR
jgi:hypothetical protein